MATTQYYNTIQQLYVAYFNRPADVPGLLYWEGVVEAANGNTAAVSKAFAASNEYKSVYANLDAYHVVGIVYQNLFGHAADVPGLTYWAQQLIAGTFTVDSVVTQIAAGAQGTDLVAYNSKVQVAAAFTANLTTSTQILAYSGDAANNAAKVFLSSIVDATTAAAAVVPATLAASINSVVFAGTPVAPVVTYNLTTGIDTIIGGAGNDIINALPNATTGVSSFTPLDSIDGGTGSNSFNIVAGAAFDSTQASGATVKNIQSVVVSNGAFSTTVDSTNWAGVQTLSVASASGGQVVTAAGTTAITATEGAGNITVNGGSSILAITAGGAITIGNALAATGAITVTTTAVAANTTAVDGGTTVNVTATGVTSGVVNVGLNTAATGAVVVTTTGALTVSGNQGAINVTGGTTITVTENIVAAGSLNSTLGNVTGGIITANGSSVTSAVTLTQTSSSGGTSTASAAATGVLAVGGVTAAPGVQGVVAVSGVDAASASSAAAAIADAKVIVADAAGTSATAANSIKTVTLASYGGVGLTVGAGASSIVDSALTTLNLSGTAGSLVLTNNNAAAQAAAASTLTLNVNGLSVGRDISGVSLVNGNTIVDAGNEIATLNVVTGASNSTLTAFTDTHLTTLNVSGASRLSLTTVSPSLTKIAISGAASFSSNVSSLGAALASFTTTSSGVITATLDANTQTFTGAVGQDVITITADALKTIKGGSATTNELILGHINTGNTFYTTTNTTANVTGFTTLGINAAGAFGTVDMTNVFTGYNSIDLRSAGTTVTFQGVTAGSPLSISGGTANVTYITSDATGPSDNTKLTLGSTSGANLNTTSLTFQDANGVGLGTLNVVSNTFAGQDGLTLDGLQTITTLVDNGLAVLNVTGNSGLTITTLNEASTQATSFTLNSSDTGLLGTTITTFTDANLGSLVFSGTNSSTITTLSDSASHVLSISNTGSGAATISAIASTANLQTLTLTGQVKIGLLTDTATGGITINGATDNQHVGFTTTNGFGAAANKIDSITLGNGNNSIADGSLAGAIKVVVGTGSNLISLGDAVAGSSANTTTSGTYAVTLGAHSATSGIDSIFVADVGTGGGITPTTVITGAAVGDLITTLDANALVLTTLTATQLASVAASSTLANAFSAAFALNANAHGVEAFVFGGNTYVIENVASATSASTSTIVELVGTHTIAAGVAVGTFTIAS